METFPAFFPLAGATVAIAGDGAGAQAKLRLFGGSPAKIARLIGDAALAASGYQGAVLAFVADDDPGFCDGAAKAARAAGALVNVVDHPELCDFHTPAIVDRDQVVAAIGTAGASPLLASLLRAEIELRVPAAAGALARLLGNHRQALRAAFPEFAHRRAFLRSALEGPAARAAEAGDMAAADRLMAQAIANGFEAMGGVWFIESGDADDLISLRATRRLAVADLVVADAHSEAFVGRHARRDAERLGLDSLETAALAKRARSGQIVAVVGGMSHRAIAGQLASLGVVVEILKPAPAP